MKNETNDVVVFLEPPGDRRDDINRGLVTEGARIARLTKGMLHAMTVGKPAAEADAIEGYGAERLIEVGGEGLQSYSGESYACATVLALHDVPFRLLLFAHSDRGKDLAARVAVLLKTAAVTDCSDIRYRDGSLSYIRPMYGGQLEQEVRYDARVPEVASIRTAGLYRREEETPLPLKVLKKSIDLPASLRVPKSLDTVPADYRTVDILYAKRIVGVGAGAAESLSPIEELAHLLGASVAATRPVVDDGFIEKARMIGQTGKTVAPDLYISLGVSGSPHHVAGVQDAKRVLSLNIDPRAPMCSFSDKAFTGDLRTLLPKLLARIKRYKGGGA